MILGQSCIIAKLAGSTPEPFDIDNDPLPKGNGMGDQCIDDMYVKFGFPKVDPAKLQAAKQRQGISTSSTSSTPSLLSGLLSGFGGLFGKRQACTPYMMIYGKGTYEVGELGMTIGPQLLQGLNKAMPNQWSGKSVDYNNDINGIYCIGMPGGYNGMQLLNSLNKQCPNTQFAMVGMSQGALVVRIAVANATPEAREKVKGESWAQWELAELCALFEQDAYKRKAIVTFGDAFNGAKVKGFPDSSLKVFCAANDGVCSGEFSITAGHMSYMMDSSSTEALNFILQKFRN